MNASGDSKSNLPADSTVNAVTWGVFPGREVMQPTVVDGESFAIWKDEAFGLWKSWASMYEDGSEAATLLSTTHDTYYLMNIVENGATPPPRCIPSPLCSRGLTAALGCRLRGWECVLRI